MGYPASLPLKIPGPEPGKRYPIPFSISDDIEGKAARIRQVVLKLHIDNLLTSDRLTVLLNGQSLADEICLRDYADKIVPYQGQWLEFHLRKVRPRKGENLLEISLDERPPHMGEGISVEWVEVRVDYGFYPTTPKA